MVFKQPSAHRGRRRLTALLAVSFGVIASYAEGGESSRVVNFSDVVQDVKEIAPAGADSSSELQMLNQEQVSIILPASRKPEIVESEALDYQPHESFPEIDTVGTLSALIKAMDVMQSHFFELWQGTWPDAIDWTAAVMGTHVSAWLQTLSSTLSDDVLGSSAANAAALGDARAHENIINRYFTQIGAFYFGENAFSLRNQAYDDMLWVVLGWLHAIKFIYHHSSLHYQGQYSGPGSFNSTGWYGAQFIPSFAHRARVFYDLASQGWDTSLCGGGMIWSPYLTPYKNAITNELFISASVSMYLYFPGDNNPSPFASELPQGSPRPAKPHDPDYLNSAIDAYDWLKRSNMTNEKGLFVDGFHIRGWGHGSNRTGTGKCDVRNEMVYTYNQGVLLSGLRGLWEATGATSYLEDGHRLVRNVIVATGFQEPSGIENDGKWAGLGRNGILEDICDAAGSCSQNGQTFKGIFFHHLTLFCAPLPPEPEIPGISFAASKELRALHRRSCADYGPWIARNARAALGTRDKDGEFGMWWGHEASSEAESLPEGSVDYRNLGIPAEPLWQGTNGRFLQHQNPRPRSLKMENLRSQRDVNDRGRGRTVETQGGGVSVLRALWEIVESQ
ncbi:glycoside hydrolase family 76 protein [Xylona heveae TC161]|uniref:Glycoside hydrolase family 76 protein n=1 Tax=Xylona heveae (strain CBS 132557 / TC161) TaxID=1328760 RepID=A0A165I6Z8_XYLHT|nr:glycoside hydrolase family 76 protein [Xylona heveae TC161]KZF24481.1 glycoside hydrolase family 76 protein [Xylona heveae TC161]